jgi:hypothetical protein
MQMQQLLRLILQLAKRIDKLGPLVLMLRLRIAQLREQFTEHLRENEALAHATSHETSKFIGYYVLVLAAFFIDAIMLGNLNRYLASTHLHNRLLVLIAALLLPLAVIIIEFGISLWLHATRCETGELGAKYWAVLFVGVACAAFVPVAATFIAIKVANTYGVEVSIPAISVMGLFSFLGHLLLLLNGEVASDAKAWVVFKAKKKSLERDINEATKKYDPVWQEFSASVIEYMHLLKQHHDLYGPFPIGPFSDVTWALLAEFGIYPPHRNGDDDVAPVPK